MGVEDPGRSSGYKSTVQAGALRKGERESDLTTVTFLRKMEKDVQNQEGAGACEMRAPPPASRRPLQGCAPGGGA